MKPPTHQLPRFEHLPISATQQWKSCAPVTRRAGKAKSQAKSFNELASRIGQYTQLTQPEYAESTKFGTAFIWDVGLSTSAVHGTHHSSWRKLNEAGNLNA